MNHGKILIIEDEKDLRDVYSLILQREGYEVKLAANGKDGYAALQKFAPDLILLDIFMPVLDGKGFLEKISEEQHSRMKIVVCSNTSDDELLSSMLKLGADKIVTKADMGPLDIAALANSYLQPA